MSSARLCPVCKRPIEGGPTTDRFRPFCSKRCADIDLGRWLRGSYAIPASDSTDESESEAGGYEPEGPAVTLPEGLPQSKPVRH